MRRPPGGLQEPLARLASSDDSSGGGLGMEVSTGQNSIQNSSFADAVQRAKQASHYSFSYLR